MKILIALFTIVIFSSAANITVDQIVGNADKRDQGKFLVSVMNLVYIDANGKILKERKLKSWRSWQNNDNESLLLKFMEPSEIKNSGFLSIKKDGVSNQKLFLPSFGKIRQIAGNSEYSSFMGSDFYYSDLKSRNISKDQNKLIAEEDKFYVVESLLNGKGKYQKLIYRINKTSWMVEEIKFFSGNSTFPDRIMQVKQTQKNGDVYIATQIIMTTFKGESQTVKSSSEITISEIEMGANIADEVYSDRNLQNEEF